MGTETVKDENDIKKEDLRGTPEEILSGSAYYNQQVLISQSDEHFKELEVQHNVIS